MGRNYRRSVLRSIRETLSRFLAIFAIVALGAGFLAGLMASSDDMRLSADSYYDDTELYDARIVSTLGLTESDLECVRQAGGVEAVLPVHDMDLVFLSEEGDSYTTRIHTLPREGDPAMNTPVLQSGRLPEKAGECVVVKTPSLVSGKDWVGETLTRDKSGEAEDEEENGGIPDTLTVVGTVKSSAYMSMEQEHSTVGSGTVGLTVYTVDETFSLDYYTGFYLTVKDVKGLVSFEQEYKDKVLQVTEALEPLGEERSQVRYEEIIGDANEQLDDAKQEYADKKAEAEEKLAEAEQKLKDGEQELAASEQKLQDARAEIDNGQKELDSNRSAYQTEMAAAQAKINDGYAQIDKYQTQLNDGKKQLEDGEKKIADAEKQLEDGQKQLDEGRKQLEDGQALLDEGYRQLDEGDKTLAQAKARLDRTESELNALEQGKSAFWQAAAQLGLPAEDTSDAATLAALGQLELLSPEAAAQFAPLKAGLEALAAQGTDTAGARAQLEAGKSEYRRGVAQAKSARAELDEKQQELAEQKTALEAKQAELTKGREELDSQRAVLTQKGKELEAQQNTLNTQKTELDSNAAALRQAQSEAQAQFASAESALADARAQYQDGLTKLDDGKKELEDGWKEYEDSKAEAEEKLADAEDQIRDAERRIREIETGQWYLFTREDNTSYASYDANADKIAAIATVFPAFFFLVAALVALTTMTRMVEEERQQIGTLKALGYSSGKIAGKYLFYAASASVAGSVFGLLVGFRLFPYIIITAYNIMYDVPKALTPFRLPHALFASCTAVACTLIATLNACWSELREVPARLMLPKAPKAGKRVFLEYITPLWNRLKFTQKVAARNLIRYKKRFFMTVVGIAGCTALLVTGFGVKDSISHIVSYQYDELNQYQLLVALKDEDALEDRDLNRILGNAGKITSFLPVMQNDGKMVPKKGDPADSITIFVPSDVSLLPDYFLFRHRNSDEPVTYDENAVIITEKLSERQHLKTGDTITVTNQDGREAAFTITDICENYVSHYLYISPAAYEDAFGQKPENNVVLCKLPEGETPTDEEALTTELLECGGVAAARFTTELSRSFDNSIKSMDSIVAVLIICAGLLAFVVLYNLTNINISERVKEIATIKVLGFYDSEVSFYIYRENAVLTLIGTAAGLVLGIFLHQFVIRTAEIDMLMFGRTVYPLSYVWSALLTILFSVLVNLVMHRKLKQISMVESMKAPE